MLYPAYKRLVDTLTAVRLKCDEKWLAVRAHRKKMRDEGKSSRRKKLFLKHFFDLPDLFFNFASVLFGFASIL
jgi:hypothetical protein